MRIGLAAAILALWAGAAAAAPCEGANLFQAMSVQQRDEIRAAAAAVPHHQGLLWRATRGNQSITLVGTYHFDDPRHQPMLARLAPVIEEAAALYLEAGPAEEQKLRDALAADPTLMVDPDGPTLPERLDDATWTRLSQAMSERGTPAVITSRLRPWYVAMMLGISPCMMRQAAQPDARGLDQHLAERAEAAGVAVRPLEPWDTVFRLFGGLTPEQEIEMILAALPAASHADDYAVTLADAYFAGDIWAIWEFGRFDAYRNSGLDRDQVDAQMALARERMMDERNRAWIGPLTYGAAKAAGQGKGIVAGFGALHLPGEDGVLRLLEKAGWTITRLDG